MTGREFSGVDLDLLADYVGGALDGTPEETVVAGLVADDPAWRAAHDALTGGTAAVGAQLRLLGAATEPMPTDVAVRLDTALTALPPLTGPVDPVGAPEEPELGDAGGPSDAGRHAGSTEPRRHLAAVPVAVGSGGGRSGTPARRRALRRWAAPVAVAAGVLAFAGIGVGELLSGGDESADMTSSVGGQAAPMMESHDSAGAAVPAERVRATGTDYRRDTLQAAAVGTSSRSVQGDKMERSSPEARVLDADSVVPALQRLSVREALIACIDAIAGEHGAGPVDVETADFARFEGSPALVVRFTASDGTWAWVSGPDCGAPGAGADTRHQVQVG